MGEQPPAFEDLLLFLQLLLQLGAVSKLHPSSTPPVQGDEKKKQQQLVTSWLPFTAHEPERLGQLWV